MHSLLCDCASSALIFGCYPRISRQDVRAPCAPEQSLFSVLPVAEVHGCPSPIACEAPGVQLLLGKPYALRSSGKYDTVLCGHAFLASLWSSPEVALSKPPGHGGG